MIAKISKECMCEWCIQGCTSHGLKIYVGDYVNATCEDCGASGDVHEVLYRMNENQEPFYAWTIDDIEGQAKERNIKLTDEEKEDALALCEWITNEDDSLNEMVLRDINDALDQIISER